MTEENTKVAVRQTLTEMMAGNANLDRDTYVAVVKKMCFSGPASNEEFAAFLTTCHTYGLNPLIKEIYAFKDKSGKIVPLVGVDGWMKLANNRPEFDGIEYVENFQDGKVVSVTAKVYRKDRAHPVIVTEYLSECAQNTEPWRNRPVRMLRHKATIQGIRTAFGFAGIGDPDDYEGREYRVEKSAHVAIANPDVLEAEFNRIDDLTVDDKGVCHE